MAYLCYKQTNLRNVFSNYPRTIPGWLTLFYMSPFGRKMQFKMAATCTNYYTKNGTSSPITMQIVNAIYGFVCLESQGIRMSQIKTHLKRLFALLIVKVDFKPTVVLVMYCYIS